MTWISEGSDLAANVGQDFLTLAAIPGSGFLRKASSFDSRGAFTKVLGARPGAHLDAQEVFWSRTQSRAIRGMHSARPGYQGWKVVTVLSGLIFDALVDLRSGPSLGNQFLCTLDSSTDSLFVPPGVVHGFQVISSEPAVVHYVTSNPYVSDQDAGVHPLSCEIPWPYEASVIGDRDLSLPNLHDIIDAGGWARQVHSSA